MTIPTTPPSRIETWLLEDYNLPAVIFFLFALLCLACWLASKVDRKPRQSAPRIPAPRQPVSSNRKAARR